MCGCLHSEASLDQGYLAKCKSFASTHEHLLTPRSNDAGTVTLSQLDLLRTETTVLGRAIALARPSIRVNQVQLLSQCLRNVLKEVRLASNPRDVLRLTNHIRSWTLMPTFVTGNGSNRCCTISVKTMRS